MKIDPTRLGNELTPNLTKTITYLDKVIEAVGKLKHPADLDDEYKRYIISIPLKIKDIKSKVNRCK